MSVSVWLPGAPFVKTDPQREHPELRIRYGWLIAATENGELPYVGVTDCYLPETERSGHVDYPLRCVSRTDLKAWMLKEHPDEKPSFLFNRAERSKGNNGEVDERSKGSFLNIIGALLAYIEGDHGFSRHPKYKSKGILEDELTEKFDAYGLSKKTLQKKFYEARKTLKTAIGERNPSD